MTNSSWTILSSIEQSIKDKISSIGVPLKDWNIHINYGIKTGLNEAFIIDSATRDALISADPKSAEIIRPILRGRDIKRYRYEFADLWLICTQTGNKECNIAPVDIERYPTIKAYLNRYYSKLEKRLDKGITPYHLRSCAYMDDFSKQKIIWREISDTPKFTLDKNGSYSLSNKAFLMTGDSLYFLLGFLNSKLCEYFFSTIATTTGVGTVQWLKYKVEALPVPQISKQEQIPFIRLVNSILECTCLSGYNTELEQKLNNLIYSIYGLTNEEIAVIEAHCHGKNK